MEGVRIRGGEAPAGGVQASVSGEEWRKRKRKRESEREREREKGTKKTATTKFFSFGPSLPSFFSSFFCEIQAVNSKKERRL